MKTVVTFLIIGCSLLSAEKPYFQQHVSYTIDVKLDDENHTLTGLESLVYTNHSPDTLTFLWYHLWPNAYRNDKSAFAKQKFEQGSTRFYYADEKDRGYIDSLDFQVNDISLEWEFHPEWNDVAKIHLPEPLAPGDSVTITTPFFVKLPVVFSRMGHTGKHYEITQWYPKPAVYDRYGWHPMPYLDMGEFYSEFGTFDVTITLPKEYRIMATGVLVNGDEEYAWLDSLSLVSDSLFALDKKAFKKAMKALQGGKHKFKKSKDGDAGVPSERKWKTLHFHQEKVHDFAWFADPKWLVRKGTLWLADSTREVTLWSMFLPKNARLWENSVEYLHDSGYWYSQFYGDYPYQHITAVDGDLSAGGGMEYPNITVISSGGSKDMLEMVIMHEVGHNWVYGILGSNERDHAWMDEGLNEYTNIRYWEKKYPDRDRAMIISKKVQKNFHVGEHLRIDWIMGYMGYLTRAVTGDDQPIELPSPEYYRRNYSAIIYGKTAVFSRYFQSLVGEEVINNIYHDYYETWKFKHPYPEDFKTIVRKHVPEGADWYLEDVFNTTKTVDYAVTSLKDGKAELVNYGKLAPPVPLAAYDGKGKVLEEKILPGFQGKQTVKLPANTRRVALDPAQRLPDLNLENNFSSHPLNFKFVFDQPDYSKHTIYWLPWLFNYNTYNGLPLGIMAYSGMIPGYPYGISIVPLLDYRNKTLAGFATIKKTWYQTLGFKTAEVHLSADRFYGHSGVKLGVKANRRNSIKSVPALDLKADFFYHDLYDDAAFNDSLYTTGALSVIRGSVSYRHAPSTLMNYSVTAGIEGAVSNADFWKIQLTTRGRYRWTKNIQTNWRAWTGGFLVDSDVPVQYATFMGGGVDPDFENHFIFDRMNSFNRSKNNLYDEQYIADGPGLRGRAIDGDAVLSTLKPAFGLNLTQSIPKLPVNLFVDLAGGSDFDLLTDAGLSIGGDGVEIFIPLYQSWDPEAVVTDGNWIKDRLRFSFSTTNVKIGF